MSAYLYDPDSPSALSELKLLPEFQVDINDLDKVIRYIILLHDIQTPYRKLFPDYPVRKKEAALHAGWKLNKQGIFDQYVENIVLGRNQVANGLIMSYLRLFNNPDYLLYVSFWEMLSREIQNSMTETDPKIIKIIRENMEKLSSAISRLEESIFGGKEVEQMRKALYASLINQRLLRPEEVAKQIANKELNLGVDPYYG
jgi:hypothetical protein